MERLKQFINTKVNGQKGFTLIEMLIVLFVIGTLLLIIVPNLMSTGTDAQTLACDANKKIISSQVESYYLHNGHTYPKSVKQLYDEGYLPEMPVCPLNVNGDEDFYSISAEGDVTYSYDK